MMQAIRLQRFPIAQYEESASDYPPGVLLATMMIFTALFDVALAALLVIAL